MKTQFNLFSPLPQSECIEALSELLSREHLLFESNADSLWSKHVPLPLVSFDLRLYSKLNWVGVNPFIYVSGITFSFHERNNGTELNVVIDRRRMWAFNMLSAAIFLIVALAMPTAAGFAFFFFMSASFFLAHDYFSGSLLKQEIERYLSTRRSD